MCSPAHRRPRTSPSANCGTNTFCRGSDDIRNELSETEIDAASAEQPKTDRQNNVINIRAFVPQRKLWKRKNCRH